MAPRLFEPFSLKDIQLRNRIAVSPMCQYSSDDGMPNDWHLVHLGSRAVGGAGLVIVEATAVSPEGRISPQDSGIYDDRHVEGFARINRFLLEQGAVPGIQLAHAGRKASAQRPWEGDAHLDEEQGGWETIAPSPLAFGGDLPKVPREMSLEDIGRVQRDFATAAQRALDAGFQWLEIHFAHGYLASEFYSPLANQRTDQYGGSFENRIRFLRETFAAVRNVWPERLPLSIRLSVTDWDESGVTLDDSIELTRLLKADGLDLLDVSHGFVIPNFDRIPFGPGMMLPAAEKIRVAVEIPTTTSWYITEPMQAETAIRNGQIDLVSLGREMLRNPYWPYEAALKLRAENAGALLPIQYHRAT